MRYRKKPIVIEATQWLRKNFDVSDSWTGIDPLGVEWLITERGITTLEGFHRVTEGDWIITGVKGEKYPCKPDIFEMTYEEVK